MRIILAVAAACLGCGVVSAQSLMQQCATIDDQAKRQECFAAVAKSGLRASPTSEERLADLSRAANSIVGAVEGGLTYVQLGDRILAFSSEIGVARSKATTDNEKAALDLYQKALQCYTDSRALWDADIRYNARNSIHMPVLVVFVQDIVNRQGLPTVAGDLLGFTRGVDAPSAIRLLWSRASEFIAEADAQLKPRDPQATPAVSAAAPNGPDYVPTAPRCTPSYALDKGSGILWCADEQGTMVNHTKLDGVPKPISNEEFEALRQKYLRSAT